MRRITRALLFLAAGAVCAAPAAAQALHDRTHENGATLVRFHRDVMHFALVLDAVPSGMEERRITFADGHTVDFRWSGRSLWIADAKYDLPFGQVFLLSTRDSMRVKQLEFKAVRSRVVLDQMETSSEIRAWVSAHGDTAAPVTRQDIEASTMPRYTLEVAEWKYRGGYALTCILSGEPQFVVVSDLPITLSGSGSTAFGGFEHVNVWVGSGDEAQMWTAKSGDATFGDLSFDFRNGRVFLYTTGGTMQQLNVPLTLGESAAPALTDEIERLPQVRSHLGME